MPMKNTLHDYLLDLDPLPEELKNGLIRNDLIQLVNAHTTLNHYHHKVLLLSAGMIPDRLYFVEKGLVRGYIEDNKGKEKTIFLWNDNSLMTDALNFVNQTPAGIYIEVMPNSTLQSISFQQLTHIFKRYDFIRNFMDKLPYYNKLYSHKSFYNFSRPSAWERYLDLKQRYAAVEQKISKEVIASFLEITPQYLSKMIKENR